MTHRIFRTLALAGGIALGCLVGSRTTPVAAQGPPMINKAPPKMEALSKDVPPGTPTPPPPPTSTIELTITPMAAPTPALKYHLLPLGLDLLPGNAPTTYMRVFSPELRTQIQRDPKMNEKVEEWMALKTADLPLDQIRPFVDAHRTIFKELDIAARKERCEWELDTRLDQESIGLLLPEVQAFREMARLLKVRARLALAEGNLDEALTAIRTGMGMAKHVGEGPTLIHALVGLAITAVMNTVVDEFIAHPKAPNLYWALTELPRPMISPQKGMAGEMRMLNTFVGDSKLLESHKMTIDEANQALAMTLSKLTQGMQMTGSAESKNTWGPFAQGIMVASQLANSKRFLIANGFDAKSLDEMPAAQVVMLSTTLEYKVYRDDMFKWMHLPYPEAHAGIRASEDSLKELRARSTTQIPVTMLTMFLPAIAKVHEAFGRSDRKFAVLRAVEAIRMHAATGGQFPKSLAEITVVPVPNDPITGKPFEYTLKDGTAEIYAGPAKRDQASVSNSVRYVLTLRK